MPEGFRLRVCFRKSGRLRFLSHLEVVRACERAARRAALPYAVSQGFTPRMRISFGPALPVGTAGQREYFDLMMTGYVEPEAAFAALTAVTVADLTTVECAYAQAGEPSLASALTIAAYDVHLEGGILPEELERSLAELMDAGTLSTEHKGKLKVFDLAEALPKEPEVSSEGDRCLVRMVVRMGEHGSLRPEVLISTVAGRDVRASVTRTDLLIDDEGAWRRPL